MNGEYTHHERTLSQATPYNSHTFDGHGLSVELPYIIVWIDPVALSIIQVNPI